MADWIAHLELVDDWATRRELIMGPVPVPRKTKSLAQHAKEAFLYQLRDALDPDSLTARYCCGDRIPMFEFPDSDPDVSMSHDPVAASCDDSQPSTSSKVGSEVILRLTSLPIKVFFQDTENSDSFTRIQFPHTGDNAEAKFDDFLKACSTASHQSERFTPAYRMNDTKFILDFHPADYGIVDDIIQIMVPGSKCQYIRGREDHLGIRAELFQLEANSNPTNFESLRGYEQSDDGCEQLFGYLVVCLPTTFTGDSIRITNNQHASQFDWGTEEASREIQWVAFYKNCQYEPCQVKSGYCVTVTYKLFLCERIGGPLKKLSASNGWQFPLYKSLEDMLNQPGFMKDGTIFGFYFDHLDYTDADTSYFPNSLKGADLAMFNTFRSLGLTPTVRPVHKDSEWEDIDKDDYSTDYSVLVESSSHWEEVDSINVEDFPGIEEYIVNTRTGFIRVGPVEHFKREELPHFLREGDGQPFLDWTEYMRASVKEIKDVVWLNSPKEKGWKLHEVVHEEKRDYPCYKYLEFHVHGAIFAKVPKRSMRMLGF